MQVAYGQIKRIKSENRFIKFDCWQLIKQLKINSNVDVEKQTLDRRSIIATEEKCRQFNWCFRYMVIIDQDATFYLT